MNGGGATPWGIRITAARGGKNKNNNVDEFQTKSLFLFIHLCERSSARGAGVSIFCGLFALHHSIGTHISNT